MNYPKNVRFSVIELVVSIIQLWNFSDEVY